MANKQYSAGLLLYPRKDDEQFEDYEAAEEAAREGSIDDSVWAVWDNETGSVEAIAYLRTVYT